MERPNPGGAMQFDTKTPVRVTSEDAPTLADFFVSLDSNRKPGRYYHEDTIEKRVAEAARDQMEADCKAVQDERRYYPDRASYATDLGTYNEGIEAALAAICSQADTEKKNK